MSIPARIALLASVVFFAAPVSAQDAKPAIYTIKAGDTLYDLAEDYFVSRAVIARVQRHNRITNPRRLQIGSKLEVPRDLLKYRQVPLRVLEFTGDVKINNAAPARNQQVFEDAIIVTPAKAFISLGSIGTSRVLLPSNSQVRVQGARRYLIDGAVDFDLRVLRGRGEVIAPKLEKPEDRFRVGTPVAVTAVRGTEFRAAFDPEAMLALTEVVEGVVEVSADGASVDAPAGFGVTSSDEGLGETETLLTAPVLIDARATQTGELVTFNAQPLPDAVGYRTQIGDDANFIEVIAENVSSDGLAEFSEIENGTYFVRSRAIAASGLEGFWQKSTDTFRRKQVGVTAQEPSPFEDALKFAWLLEGTSQSYAAFQLWKKDQPDQLIVDEVGLPIDGLFVGKLEPGPYQWRVATFQLDSDDVIKVWSPVQDINVSE